MKLKALLTEERAVSPVIGVILMVAITVILAAVIGTFVLGLGDQVSQSQPNANTAFNYSNIDDGTATNDVFGITHEGGDKLDGNNLKITAGGTNIYESGTKNGAGTIYDDQWGDDSITAGDVFSYEEGGTDEYTNGDTVRVIWSSDSGDTAIIAEGEVS